MRSEINLRDLVYFDFDKAASIFSQVEGGLLREIQSGIEASHDNRNVHNIDLKLYKPQFGGGSTEKTSQLESRVLHHDLLARIESKLDELGVAVDINSALESVIPTPELIRSKIAGLSYVRAEGWSVIEDYSRFYEFTRHFNDITEFIGRCAVSAAEQTTQYKEIQDQLDSARASVDAEKDRNKKAKLKAKVKDIESDFRKQLTEATKVGEVQDWLMDGIRLFIDTFIPGRINFRVCPFETVPDFQVLANLKKDCFVDGDLENVLFAYGTRPNVKLTVFGLLTSVPSHEGTGFNLWDEFKKSVAENSSEEKAFEVAFRGVFNAMEGFERFVRFSYYPNITVYPIAVYRTIRLSQ